VHRAKFLDELLALIPNGIAEFNKKLVDLVQDKDGVTITFGDCTSARASAVIACDGIKSLCRRFILGKDSRQAEPVFAGEYAYRTLLDRELANSILTPELAGNGNIYCGHGAYVRTPKDIHPFAFVCTCTLPDFIGLVFVSDVCLG
jgi:salicylate hydroxylase